MNKKLLYILIVIFIVICGISGLIFSEGYNFLDALFSTITMFMGGYSDPTNSVLINIARFGALAVTASTLLVLFNNLYKYLHDSYISKQKGSIFVYGNNHFSDEFIKSSKSRIINRDKYFNADRYVLLDSDEANMNFINTNKDNIGKKNVYIKSSVFSNTIINDGLFRFFSLEEIFSKKYWKENSLLEKAFGKNNKPTKELNIIIIGFDKLAEEILRKGTIVNIFSQKQEIKYHLFGNTSMFKAYHKNLDKLNITCYEDDFVKHTKLLENADRIIYIAKEQDLNNVNDLIGFLDRGEIHIILDHDIDSSLFTNHKYRLNENTVVKTIDWLDSICTEDNIINQKDIDAAKKMNAAYSGSFDLCDKKWEKLDTFTKYSNIASVDYYNLTIVRLLEKLTGKEYSRITDDEFYDNIDLLSELEHIRWCNYHWLCNWKFDKETNKQKKTHNCLIPYRDLSKKEKDKDLEQVMFMRKHYFEE